MSSLALGFSPCPNDTFIFYAAVHRRVDLEGLTFTERLEDVETLNSLALAGALDITKVSCHAVGLLRDKYWLLRSGGAVGRGCGPLVVGKKSMPLSELRGKRIAIPGKHTTAALLLRLFDPGLDNLIVLPFHEIMGAVAKGEVEAGVIIHESRFTYQSLGLQRLLDLGEWWENHAGLPIPLGGIMVKRTLGEEKGGAVERILRASISYARANGAEVSSYIRAHSQEMSEDVCAAHIGLYVNEFSTDLGDEGMKAVSALLSQAEEAGILPRSSTPLFLP